MAEGNDYWQHVAIHVAYVDLALNIADLRSQVERWTEGEELGLLIAREKAARAEALLDHVSWPQEMRATVDALRESLHPLAEALNRGDLAATQGARPRLSAASHDLAHAFYDQWLSSAM